MAAAHQQVGDPKKKSDSPLPALHPSRLLVVHQVEKKRTPCRHLFAQKGGGRTAPPPALPPVRAARRTAASGSGQATVEVEPLASKAASGPGQATVEVESDSLLTKQVKNKP